MAICAFALLWFCTLPPALATGEPDVNTQNVLDTSARFFNRARLNLTDTQFKNALKNLDNAKGAICIVKNGNIILEKSYNIPAESDSKSFAMGKTTSAITSLAAVAAQENELINLRSPLARYCSYFRLNTNKNASIEDLLRGNIGFDKHSDTLVPMNASAAEIFDIAAQLPTTQDIGINQSLLTASIAGYALGYIADKSEKDFKKSFAKALYKFVLKPLDMTGARYRAFDTPFFPANALALQSQDIGKWLCAETSPSPKIATANAISARRAPTRQNGKIGMGWIKTSKNGIDFFMCGDFFQNCANLVAVFPQYGVACAFVIKAQDASKASRTCQEALERVIDTLSIPIPPRISK